MNDQRNASSKTCPRLIEVALPIREISAESMRDKSLRHGHISTLHLWWARRPLPAARAVVFASLVPDPDDPACPEEFRQAVGRHLKTHVASELKRYMRGRNVVRDDDPYRPYDGMPDTLRNRLLMFMAMWSPEALAFEQGKSGKEPKPAELLDDRSLVKWETSDPENPQGQKILEIARQLVEIAHGGKTPTVLDPFSGGGAIPLEAGRLGCRPIANDYNPVAYLILRATCEFPQKYGRPGKRTVTVEELGRRVEQEIDVPNVLRHDVEHWANWILEKAREKIGHLYPAGKAGMPVVGYLWARTAPCSNCRAEIPLLRSLLLCERTGKRIALTMTTEGKKLVFGIAKGKDIPQTEGTMLTRGNCRCPFRKQTTRVQDLRRAGLEGKLGERMVAVITDTPQGKGYRAVDPSDLKAYEKAVLLAKTVERPSEPIRPEVTQADEHVSHRGDITVHLYGMKTWGSLFNARQLVAVQNVIAALREASIELEREEDGSDYGKAVLAYLGLWVSRCTMFQSNLGLWKVGGEFLATPFGMQTIPMVWDYAETNPLSDTTGGILSQLDWVLRFITHETPDATSQVVPARVLNSDGGRLPLATAATDVVVTDPPYFDAVAYADLSDFFYIWLKRSLGEVFNEPFATPLTPKAEEATALKHRHRGDGERAKEHCTKKLAACFAESKRACKPDGILAVMFAHQSTEAWTALINALFEAGLNVTASYPIDTERGNRPRGLDSSALESSITVICRSREVGAAASFKDVRRQIQEVVRESVHRFWDYGFRGADLIVACYGPAVGEFGRYERVERADGTPLTVPELLALARECALKAIAGEFTGDTLSRLYFVWSNLYGTAEQAWDDARLVVQVGGEADDAMEVARRHGIFVVDGATCRLATLADRADRRGLGSDPNPPLIDALHRSLLHWKQEKRRQLVDYLAERDLMEDGPFWKLAQALFEVLPHETEDWKLVSALLGERQTLRSEAKQAAAPEPQQGLFQA